MFEAIKNIILDELRAKGYAPNPSDVVGAVKRIIDLVEGNSVEEAKRLASAGAPLITPPSGGPVSDKP